MSQTATVTLLLTDLVDSTRLVSELGDAAAAALMARHDRVARDLLPRHSGREIDKSDGFLHIFESPGDGVAYAHAYHRALAELSRDEGLLLSARAGLHTGSVRLTWNSAEDVALGAKPCEVEGIAKATAARIMTLAMGGQTLVSAATRQAIAPTHDGRADMRIVSHGHYRLKGVAEPLEIFEVAAVQEGVLRPPPDTAKVHRVVRTAGGWRPAREVPNNLPPDRVGFFGRTAELRAIADRFAGGARLLTLAGPGGTGKTHLSTRYARAWLGDWPGGAWFCDLADAHSELDIARALGAALQVPLDQGDPIDILGDALSQRERTLILLDNFEQIVDFAEATVARWLDRAPAVAWLVTSRQRLDLRGEQLVVVEPLPLPDPDDDLLVLRESPAMQLFTARAQSVQPRFRLDAESAPHVARLVRLLDGLPLALELAAARVRVLPPKRILDRMGRRFDLLRGQRGRGARHSTLKGTIDWSWDLLAPHERWALAQCAVFEGTFDLEAAESVLDLSPWPDAPWPMDTVESLVDQSLVRAVVQPDGETRFGLFRSIRDYAQEKLADPRAVLDGAGEAVSGRDARAEVEARHAEHYARWGDPAELAALHGPGGEDLRARLAADLDNLIVAVRYAADADRAEAAAGAALGALALLRRTGPFPLAEELTDRALALEPAEEESARLLLAQGVVRNRAGRAEEAVAVLQRARDIGAALRDRGLEGRALAALGYSQLHRGQLETAERTLAEALRLLRRSGDRVREAEALMELAHVVGIRGGRFEEGRSALEQAITIQEQEQDLAGEALTRSYLGAIYAIQGSFGPGLEHYTRSRDLARQVGDRRTEGLAEGMIATIHFLQQRYAEAGPAFRSALRIQTSIGDKVHEAMLVANYSSLLQTEGQLDEAARMMQRAIAIARETGDPRTEGLSLGSLGEIRAQAGRLGEALVTLQEGEARLREAGDPTELAKLLCKLSMVQLQLDDREAAAESHGEAATTAAELGVGEDSELAQRLRALSLALAG